MMPLILAPRALLALLIGLIFWPASPGLTAKLDADSYQELLLEALITAEPGQTINLPEGTFYFDEEMSIYTEGVILKGEGMGETIFNFSRQKQGAQSFYVGANGVTLQDFSIIDAPSDAIKAISVDGFVARALEIKWTKHASPQNGGYGIYPVKSRNILVEACKVSGASDAGIYVGQSRSAWVKNNEVFLNVAGIEIENTIDAHVEDNKVHHNTAGILIFDLPDLSQAGGHAEVRFNDIYDNNLENFAPPANVVAEVPSGTGMMLMATRDVEVSANRFSRHRTSHLLIVSYLLTGRKARDPLYRPYNLGLKIRDNDFNEAGYEPTGGSSEGSQITVRALRQVLGLPFPDIVFDGSLPPYAQKLEDLNESDKICIQGPLAYSLVDLDWPHEFAGLNRQLERFDCQLNTEHFTKAYPKSLSEWNILKLIDDKLELGPQVDIYSLNNALFSDFALKLRLIKWPYEGAKALYKSEGPWEFPVGTVIAKNFAYPATKLLSETESIGVPIKASAYFESGDSELVLLETRLLIKEPTGWVALPYIWPKGSQDATLALSGKRERFQLEVDGAQVLVQYQVPNMNQCKSCHMSIREYQKILEPIGLRSRFLNRPTWDGGDSQIQKWLSDNKLEGAPIPEAIPRAASAFDPKSGDIEARARAYLDINCAYCHRADGPAASTGLYLRSTETDRRRLGICKNPVAPGNGGQNFPFDIVPGDYSRSFLWQRLASTEPEVRMPEIGRSLSDPRGVDLIKQWINSLSGECEPLPIGP